MNKHSPRPYENDYSGAWRGHCKSLESAIGAAHKRLVAGEYRTCTISLDGTAEARLHWTPMGIMTWGPQDHQQPKERTEMRTSLKGHPLPETEDEFHTLLADGTLKYRCCFRCDNQFSRGNVHTASGWRETQITGFCETCFDTVTDEGEPA